MASMSLKLDTAEKRIPVKAATWELLSTLKKPGQTYDDLLGEMIEIFQERNFLLHIEEIERTGEFVSLKEAARELGIREEV